MALFGLGKKKEDIPPMDMPAPDLSYLPVDRILQMRQQGLNNDQIVQSLQREGYTSDQIFEAMNQADIKGNIETVAPEDLDTTGYEGMAEAAPHPASGYGSQPYGPGYSEEMVETMIEEKYNEMAKEFSRVNEWKERTDERLARIEQNILDLRDEFQKLHTALIGKIAEYDQNILNVGTEIKAMEKVFQKVLPTFTQNINELSRITKGLKK